MTKDSKWVRMVADKVLSNVIESMRRKREENSAGLSVKMSMAVSKILELNRNSTYPMLADVLGF